MKENKYKVWFSNCNYEPEVEYIRAFNQGEALILAQAKRIRKGSDYTLYKIEQYGS